MEPTVHSCKIAGPVLEALASQVSDHPTHGFLYGYKNKNDVCITAVYKLSEELKSGSFIEHFLKSRCIFPIGVDPVGIFLFNCDLKETSNIVPMSSYSKLPDVLLCLHSSQSDSPSLSSYNRMTKELQTLSYTPLDGNPYSDHILFRLTAVAELSYKFSSKRSDLLNNYQAAVAKATKSLTSDDITFELSKSEVLVGNTLIIGASKNQTVESVLSMQQKRYRSSVLSSDDLLDDRVQVELLKTLTRSKTDNAPSYSPVIIYDRADDMMVDVRIPLDYLILADKSTQLQHLPALFYRAVVRNIQAAQEKLTTIEGTDLPTLEVNHFSLAGRHLPVTLMFTSNKTDEELVGWRTELHDQLMLPADRPFFRRANKIQLDKEEKDDARLINPHLRAKLPKALQDSDGGEVYTVYGRYGYYHYMQDNFNDDKWGCAYRSLQTLVSWFYLQGYTTVQPPTHREIQQTLVDIGDKESTFVGSKQWIGSTEVSFVLDKLLGVTSKILFVSSGAEMASQGRELVHHFKTQGTPIMIGGGVLAHTILGVYYNSLTGDIRFLILDPHYTGGEDLKIIVDKGWCGWKDKNFWDSKAYYNMCMPQRPAVI